HRRFSAFTVQILGKTLGRLGLPDSGWTQKKKARLWLVVLTSVKSQLRSLDSLRYSSSRPRLLKDQAIKVGLQPSQMLPPLRLHQRIGSPLLMHSRYATPFTVLRPRYPQHPRSEGAPYAAHPNRPWDILFVPISRFLPRSSLRKDFAAGRTPPRSLAKIPSSRPLRSVPRPQAISETAQSLTVGTTAGILL